MPTVDGAATSPAVTVEQVGYRYPDGPAALTDISFTLQAGESAAVVGPNGAGKTIVSDALRHSHPKIGRITVAGLDLSSAADRKKWPKRRHNLPEQRRSDLQHHGAG